jgi:hypothetical protein
MKAFLKGLLLMVVDVVVIFFITIIFFIALFSEKAKAEDLTIHDGNDSHYYQNLDQQDFIVLPNGERIEKDEIGELIEKEMGEPFRTREDLDIIKMYDNQYYMEKDYENKTEE